MSAALLTIFGGVSVPLIGLLVWWIKKRNTVPTPEEKLDAELGELSQEMAELQEARERDDHAAAESILRRLRQRHAASIHPSDQLPAR